jgi:hypothetical protein
VTGGSVGTLWAAIQQMAARQWAGLEHSLPYWGLGATLCIAVGLNQTALGSHSNRLRRAVLGAAMLGALAYGLSLRWISDDAFISFRYANNLIHGHGLVFNPGERVEGYTNFLWTLLMAAGLALGVDPTWTATVLGLGSLLLLPLLTERIVARLRPRSDAAPLPFAALAVGASYCLASYGTSGLETMFATALVSFALERAMAGAVASAGTAAVLATLAHPDHGLLYAGLGAALLVARRPWRQLVAYAAPFLLLFVPYFLWRYDYYCDLVPNTFHTKSGELAYFSQGWVYLLSFFVGSGLWAVSTSLTVGVAEARDRVFRGYLVLGVLPYLVYVAKIGGDFMYGRLLCVVLPPLFVLAELAVLAWLAGGRRARAGFGIVALALTGAPPAVLGERGSDWHISDEGRFYRLASLSPLQIESYYFQVAQDMRRHLTRLPVDPWLAFDCVGMTGYLSGLPLVDRWGLTDAHVAHQRLVGRGRPGHEKRAHPGYLLSRGVHFSDVPVFPAELSRWTEAQIGKTRFFVVQHDPAVMLPLGRRQAVRLPSPVRELDRLTRAPLDSARPAQRACEAWVLDEVYVQRWGSIEQRRRLYAAMLLQSEGVARADVERVGFDGLHSHVVDAASALHFDPSAGELHAAAGQPAAALLTRGGVGIQSEVFGHSDWFVNSFATPAGDGLVTTLRSRPFELRGDVLELKVGGGRDPQQLRVELRIDGQVRFSATGCQAEQLGRRLWFIEPYRGRQAVLEIHDGNPGPWGHLLVDEVRQWLPRRATPAIP